MACSNCGSVGCKVATGSEPAGCNSTGGCASGGCNRFNTYNWLSDIALPEYDRFNLIEVSFRNGKRKGFYINPIHTHATTGDMVVVEAESGFDIGKVSLSGELVRLQLKRKNVSERDILPAVIRRANERDMERLQEARSEERDVMIRARVIARSLHLEMKIGDVEIQADRRKGTFFYTADGRVDFRELIRYYAKEFRVKIEMRQIGARQESALIGGLGSCGRELCCSTWLTDFKSVSTGAARYQNLAINQAKLSGQCGRLKCCLNYELDAYLDALEEFPHRADRLETEMGNAFLIKTDVFKRLMYYGVRVENGFTKTYVLHISQVKDVQAMNAKGIKPAELSNVVKATAATDDEEEEVGFADVTGQIELPDQAKKRKKKKPNKNKRKPNAGDAPPRPPQPPKG